MIHVKKMLFLLLSLMLKGVGGFILIGSCYGQNTPFFTSGTEFALPYLGRQSTLGIAESPKSRSYIQITALNHTCGTVEVPNRNFTHRFSLAADSSLLVTLPRDSIYHDTINNAGIRVSSQFPVQVVFTTDVGILDSTLAKGDYSSSPLADSLDCEASAITPLPEAAADYILNIPNFHHPIHPYRERLMHFWVHAPYDSTEINMRLNSGDAFKPWPINAYFTRLLNKDQCFYTDLNGSFPPPPLDPGLGFVGSDIKGTGSNPFLVFTGRPLGGFSTCTDISSCNGGGYTNHYQFEQAKPITYGDTLHFAAQIQDHAENLYSILALEDSTAVKLNGSLLGYINKGRQIDTCYFGEAVFNSDKPTLLTLSRSSTICFNSLFLPNFPNASSNSPFSITMPGSDELMKRSVLKPFSEDYENTYVVALFTPTADTAQFTLDGQPLPAGSWKPFGAKPGWAWAQVEVNDNTHIMESSGAGFLGYHYSYAKKRPNYYFYPSYGYCLIESKAVPEDSLHFYIKTENSPKEKFQSFDEAICVGATFEVFANAAQNVTWKWDFGNGRDTLQEVTKQKTSAITHSYSQPGRYWVVVSDTSGCAIGDSVLIQVTASPEADFSVNTMISCEGTLVQLVNESKGANSYSWELPDGASSTENSPSFNYTGNGEITITLTATNDGCSDKVTKLIDTKTEAFNGKISNVFSPNGDGVNDCYQVSNDLDFYNECFEISIFNRWGKEIWQSSNPQDCWDGSMEGAEAAAGTYFYILRLAEQEYTGHITLMR